jgi:serine/threonine-protein kinase
MGSVWLADHLALKTQVVVKFMATELALNQDAVKRFAREASAAAQVKSPHVVQMLDHGVTDDGIPYIVMELLEGRELSKYLEERGPLPPNEVAIILAQMAKALRRAHERRIVHRDIKPDNIFLCDVGGNDLFVKLLDFGIAKATDGQELAGGAGTRTGAMVGTPYYMSPEQLVGAKDIDYRTDLWSLAVVAYQALTTALPFTAETIAGLALAIHNGPTPIPSQANPKLTPGIDAWFARACARDPKARFASAVEMADAFAQAIGTAPQAAASGPELPRAGSDPALPVASAASLPMQSGSGVPIATQETFGSTLQPGGVPKRRSAAPLFVGIGAAVVLVLGGALFLSVQKTTAPSATASAPAPPASSAAVASAAPLPPSTTTPTPPATNPAATTATPTLASAALSAKPPTLAATAKATATAARPATTNRPTTPAAPKATSASKDFDHQ